MLSIKILEKTLNFFLAQIRKSINLIHIDDLKVNKEDNFCAFTLCWKWCGPSQVQIKLLTQQNLTDARSE